jgi:hypothetical protein
MIEKMEWKMVSRRSMFPFLGLAVVFGLAVRPTEVEAQTAGMERRQQRREQRHERRAERRARRHGGTNSQNPSTTGQPAPSEPAKTQ